MDVRSQNHHEYLTLLLTGCRVIIICIVGQRYHSVVLPEHYDQADPGNDVYTLGDKVIRGYYL